MPRDPLKRYDGLPYTSYPYRYSSPENIGTIATIFGMAPAPADRCRVLEIGCSSGGNLLPLAVYWPDSRFVGVDLSPVQIDEGIQESESLSLTNLELLQGDILEIDASYGKFDYIICHGVYSWVPTDVQGKILQICRENLEPNGVAFVSFNTYPGWHENQAIREMMCYHVDGIDDPLVQVQHARQLIKSLREQLTDRTHAGSALQARYDDLLQRRDAYLYHEFLAPTNSPEYFFQFMNKAMQHGLRYLGDAKPRIMTKSKFPATIDHGDTSVRDYIRIEQYNDFARQRKFRHALLTHREQSLQHELSLDRLGMLYVASCSEKIHNNASDGGERSTFKFANDVTLSTGEPILIAVLTELAAAWPDSVRLSDLFSRVLERLAMDRCEQHGQVLCERIVKYFFDELIEVSTLPSRAAKSAGDRPTAFVLARHQATRADYISNLRHECISSSYLGEFRCQLLARLDGQLTKRQIGTELADLGNPASVSHSEIDASLQFLADHFLLTRER